MFRSRRTLLKNENGFSLVEVLIATGISGVVTLGASYVMVTTRQAQKKAELSSNYNLMFSQIAQVFGNPQACRSALRNRLKTDVSISGFIPFVSVDPSSGMDLLPVLPGGQRGHDFQELRVSSEGGTGSVSIAAVDDVATLSSDMPGVFLRKMEVRDPLVKLNPVKMTQNNRAVTWNHYLAKFYFEAEQVQGKGKRSTFSKLLTFSVYTDENQVVQSCYGSFFSEDYCLTEIKGEYNYRGDPKKPLCDPTKKVIRDIGPTHSCTPGVDCPCIGSCSSTPTIVPPPKKPAVEFMYAQKACDNLGGEFSHSYGAAPARCLLKTDLTNKVCKWTDWTSASNGTPRVCDEYYYVAGLECETVSSGLDQCRAHCCTERDDQESYWRDAFRFHNTEALTGQSVTYPIYDPGTKTYKQTTVTQDVPPMCYWGSFSGGVPDLARTADSVVLPLLGETANLSYCANGEYMAGINCRSGSNYRDQCQPLCCNPGSPWTTPSYKYSLSYPGKAPEEIFVPATSMLQQDPVLQGAPAPLPTEVTRVGQCIGSGWSGRSDLMASVQRFCPYGNYAAGITCKEPNVGASVSFLGFGLGDKSDRCQLICCSTIIPPKLYEDPQRPPAPTADDPMRKKDDLWNYLRIQYDPRGVGYKLPKAY